MCNTIFLYGKTNGVLLKAIELMFHTNENMSNLNRKVTYIMQNVQKVLNDVTFITTLVKYFCQCQKRMLEDEKQLQKGVLRMYLFYVMSTVYKTKTATSAFLVS